MYVMGRVLLHSADATECGPANQCHWLMQCSTTVRCYGPLRDGPSGSGKLNRCNAICVFKVHIGRDRRVFSAST
jgi:hypothetical protein